MIKMEIKRRFTEEEEAELEAELKRLSTPSRSEREHRKRRKHLKKIAARLKRRNR